jgi:hypothetical protein
MEQLIIKAMELVGAPALIILISIVACLLWCILQELTKVKMMMVEMQGKLNTFDRELNDHRERIINLEKEARA